jgi:hypothetical protein
VSVAVCGTDIGSDINATLRSTCPEAVATGLVMTVEMTAGIRAAPATAAPAGIATTRTVLAGDVTAVAVMDDGGRPAAVEKVTTSTRDVADTDCEGRVTAAAIAAGFATRLSDVPACGTPTTRLARSGMSVWWYPSPADTLTSTTVTLGVVADEALTPPPKTATKVPMAPGVVVAPKLWVTSYVIAVRFAGLAATVAPT